MLVQRDGVDELRLAYDGVGRRRLERRGKAPANSDDVVLEYDRGNVIQETAAKTGAIAFSTIHAPALDAPVVSWFGQLQPSTTVYDLGTDVRGDVTIAFKNGTVHEEQLLSAYGEREASDVNGTGCVEGLDAGSRSLPVAGCTTLTVLQRFGIGGARQHPATKLVDLRHRVYAPHLRGFLTKDPLGAVDSDSLFAYVAADPVNLRDHWGLAVSETSNTVTFDDVDVCKESGGCKQPPPACDADCLAARRAGNDEARMLQIATGAGAIGAIGVGTGVTGVPVPILVPGATPPPMYAPGVPTGGWQMPARGFGEAPRAAPGPSGPPKVAPGGPKVAPRLGLPGAGILLGCPDARLRGAAGAHVVADGAAHAVPSLNAAIRRRRRRRRC